MEDQDRRGGWHLDKTVTIGQISTIFVLIVSAALYIGANEADLAWLEQQIEQEEEARKEADDELQKRLERMSERNIRQYKAIQTSLTRIEERLRQKEDKNGR